MRLAELIADLHGPKEVSGDADISGVCIDSRRIAAGDLFVCLPGSRSDSHEFLDDAFQAGAAGAVVARREAFESLRIGGRAVVSVEDATDACWRICKRFYKDPSARMKMVGVTGTNGKTTVAWILDQLLRRSGMRSAYLGTLGVTLEDECLKTELTTPFPPEIYATLADIADQGAQVAVMEVSSHALAQKRVDGIEFDLGIFTNLSQDHLDFHSDLEEYFQAKRRLFHSLPTSKEIVTVANADDEFGRRLLAEAAQPVGFGSNECDMRLLDAEASVDSLRFSASWRGKRFDAHAPMGARFNVINCLAAITAAAALGVDPESSAGALASIRPAPGRFESVPTGSDFSVIVDYAHTPDALEKLLASVRELGPRHVLTVFGCGGDRDRAKRPLMAKAVSERSDAVYLTSDNPRTEDPDRIVADALPGVLSNVETHVNPDRAAAIRDAISEARSGDIVVIAGKGHEEYQILGTEKVPFDDRKVAAQAIAERLPCG
ncbi:MAG: UDP-N-acetylmuramoyl-L-alanyl-D-glutamate--2,6-diaminopimelate ligase [Armatimonadetes bacterium]|nr:UDP-N-acetylmuramoyl-L-alanyl-D-glutamate--2,6-diaminopimelate ligase [Armatimonadota bacterium]